MADDKRKIEPKGREDRSLGNYLRQNSDGFVAGVMKLGSESRIPPDHNLMKFAKQAEKAGKSVTKDPKKGKLLSGLEKEVSSIDATSLSFADRGRLAAINKKTDSLRKAREGGLLSREDEALHVSKAASSAFALTNSNPSATKDKGKGLFGLMAKSHDTVVRNDLRDDFGRGLVTDVAKAKGMSWTSAAGKLGDLGLLKKDDPRLQVSDKDVSKKKAMSQANFDNDEVNSGTAATSVLQMGRSLDDTTQSMGKRMDSAMKNLRETKTEGPSQKASNHFDRAAMSEAAGVASAKAGGSKKQVNDIFAISAANTDKGTDILSAMRRPKQKHKDAVR